MELNESENLENLVRFLLRPDDYGETQSCVTRHVYSPLYLRMFHTQTREHIKLGFYPSKRSIVIEATPRTPGNYVLEVVYRGRTHVAGSPCSMFIEERRVAMVEEEKTGSTLDDQPEVAMNTTTASRPSINPTATTRPSMNNTLPRPLMNGVPHTLPQPEAVVLEDPAHTLEPGAESEFEPPIEPIAVEREIAPLLAPPERRDLAPLLGAAAEKEIPPPATPARRPGWDSFMAGLSYFARDGIHLTASRTSPLPLYNNSQITLQVIYLSCLFRHLFCSCVCVCV